MIIYVVGVITGLALSRTKFGKDVIHWTERRCEALEVRKHVSEYSDRGVTLAKAFWTRLRGHDYLEESKKPKEKNERD
jgi:hypothetical protein